MDSGECVACNGRVQNKDNRSVLQPFDESECQSRLRLFESDDKDEWFSDEMYSQQKNVSVPDIAPNQARIERPITPKATEAVISRNTFNDTARSIMRQAVLRDASPLHTRSTKTEKGGFRRTLRRIFGFNTSKPKSINTTVKRQDTQAKVETPSSLIAPVESKVETVLADQHLLDSVDSVGSVESAPVKLQRRDTFENLFDFDSLDITISTEQQKSSAWDKISQSTDHPEVLTQFTQCRSSFDDSTAPSLRNKDNSAPGAEPYKTLSTRSDPIDQLSLDMDISYTQSDVSSEICKESSEPESQVEASHRHGVATPKNADEDTQRLADKVLALEKELALLKEMVQSDIHQTSSKSKTTRSHHIENEDFIETGIRSTSYDALFEVESTETSTKVEKPTIQVYDRSNSFLNYEEGNAQRSPKAKESIVQTKRDSKSAGLFEDEDSQSLTEIEEPTIQAYNRSYSSVAFEEENTPTLTQADGARMQNGRSSISVTLFEEEILEDIHQEEKPKLLPFSADNDDSEGHSEEEIDWSRIRRARQPLGNGSLNADGIKSSQGASLNEATESATKEEFSVFSDGFDPLDHLDDDLLLRVVQRPAKTFTHLVQKESVEKPRLKVVSSSELQDSLPREIKTKAEDSAQSIDLMDSSLQIEYDESWNQMLQEEKERKKKSQLRQYRKKQSGLHATSRSTRRRQIASLSDDSLSEPLAILPPASTKLELGKKSKGNRNSRHRNQIDR